MRPSNIQEKPEAKLWFFHDPTLVFTADEQQFYETLKTLQLEYKIGISWQPSGDYRILGDLDISRLEYIKEIHILLEAATLLKEYREDFVIWISGEGSMGSLYREQTEQKGLSDHVKFWGMVTNVPSFLKNVDIYVQPSLQDTQPFSVTEAQLAGIPVIVADTAGMAERGQDEKTDRKKTEASHEWILDFFRTSSPNFEKSFSPGCNVPSIIQRWI